MSGSVSWFHGMVYIIIIYDGSGALFKSQFLLSQFSDMGNSHDSVTNMFK